MRERAPLDPFRLEQMVTELRDELHERYLDADQLAVAYIPRAEHERRAALRREWPMVFAAAASAAAAIGSLLILVLGR